jgi:hypothetical protein
LPYPPKSPRKHPELPVGEARALHLKPYGFKRGQSGNPTGMSKSQRELYLEARGLAHKAGPGAIRRLAELAGIPLAGEEWTPLASLDIDPRVVYMACTALAERAYGKPTEFNPDRATIDAEPSVSFEEHQRRAREEIDKAFAERRSEEATLPALPPMEEERSRQVRETIDEEGQRRASEEIEAAFAEEPVVREYARGGPREDGVAQLPTRYWRPPRILGEWSG